ncbi:PKD domain-containing protein [uncultured Acetobacteroides sp.]|uniref:PKD domain-containing protein n=1 Tax=uncultured Acetobacteroides sp. TaxID=1760811 RepID=UPI0029F588A9|nr:PKD domain-containing protein [uncultured Acetobacteroides sp.]
MKSKLLFLIGLAAIFSSCSKDGETLTPNFDVVVTGKSPNAEITIVNKSTSATSFEWVFGEGSSVATCKDQTPAKVIVDKAGDFTITLKATNGSETKELTKTVKVEGLNGIALFKDVELSQVAGDTKMGRCLSVKTGKVYKDAEAKDASKDIDLIYYGSQSAFIYFESPDQADKITLSNPKKTLVQNYKNRFDVKAFDALVDDSSIKNLNVVNDESAIGSLEFPLTVTFKTAEGKVGIIKIKAINADRILFDMKVQKY